MSTSTSRPTVTQIPGDGIGPECVNAAVDIIGAVGVDIDWDERHAGERVFEAGIASGVPDDTIESIHRTRVVLKGNVRQHPSRSRAAWSEHEVFGFRDRSGRGS